MRMKPDPKSKITEGEIYGAPVPGGWPDRGPFQVLGNALSRVFGRRRSGDRADERRRPADDDREPKSANPAEHEPEK